MGGVSIPVGVNPAQRVLSQSWMEIWMKTTEVMSHSPVGHVVALQLFGCSLERWRCHRTDNRGTLSAINRREEFISVQLRTDMFDRFCLLSTGKGRSILHPSFLPSACWDRIQPRTVLNRISSLENGQMDGESISLLTIALGLLNVKQVWTELKENVS